MKIITRISRENATYPCSFSIRFYFFPYEDAARRYGTAFFCVQSARNHGKQI
jgi:hypothetical protein